MFKRLKDNEGQEYYIDRDEVWMLMPQGDEKTFFYVRDQTLLIPINFENAVLWLTSTNR